MASDVKEVHETELVDITFASIRGKGVDNYEGNGKIYKVAATLGKKEAKRIRKAVMKFYEDNKTKGMDEKPANWKNITFIAEGTGEESISLETGTTYPDGDPITIGIIDIDNEKLDPEIFSKIGSGSKGWIYYTMAIYETGNARAKKEGVSMFLTSVQLSEFVPYAGGNSDGTSQATKKKGNKLGTGDKTSKKDKKKKKEKK